MGTGSVPAPGWHQWVLPAPTLLRGCFHGRGIWAQGRSSAGPCRFSLVPQFPPELRSPQAQPVLTPQMAAGGFVPPGRVWVSRARVLQAVKLLPWKLPMDTGINVMPGLCLHRESGWGRERAVCGPRGRGT